MLIFSWVLFFMAGLDAISAVLDLTHNKLAFGIFFCVFSPILLILGFTMRYAAKNS